MTPLMLPRLERSYYCGWWTRGMVHPETKTKRLSKAKGYCGMTQLYSSRCNGSQNRKRESSYKIVNFIGLLRYIINSPQPYCNACFRGSSPPRLVEPEQSDTWQPLQMGGPGNTKLVLCHGDGMFLARTCRMNNCRNNRLCPTRSL